MAGLLLPISLTTERPTASPIAAPGEEVSMSTIQASPSEQRTWGSDFFGTLNTLPPEPVALIAQVLEAMRTQPAFQRARRTMLAGLRLSPGMHVLDAGAGTGAA